MRDFFFRGTSGQGQHHNSQSFVKQVPLITKVLQDAIAAIPGVSTFLSTTDKNVTLDIGWTVLYDLVYDFPEFCWSWSRLSFSVFFLAWVGYWRISKHWSNSFS